MLNPKHLWVICRVPCIHNILVISHHLMLFHGSPSPSSAITFLNVIWFFCPLRHKRRSLSSSTTCLLEESCLLKQIGEQWQPDFAFLDLHLRVGKNNTPGELPETGDQLWSWCAFHPRRWSDQWSRRHAQPVCPFPCRGDRNWPFGLHWLLTKLKASFWPHVQSSIQNHHSHKWWSNVETQFILHVQVTQPKWLTLRSITLQKQNCNVGWRNKQLSIMHGEQGSLDQGEQNKQRKEPIVFWRVILTSWPSSIHF